MTFLARVHLKKTCAESELPSLVWGGGKRGHILNSFKSRITVMPSLPCHQKPLSKSIYYSRVGCTLLNLTLLRRTLLYYCEISPVNVNSIGVCDAMPPPAPAPAARHLFLSKATARRSNSQILSFPILGKARARSSSWSMLLDRPREHGCSQNSDAKVPSPPLPSTPPPLLFHFGSGRNSLLHLA